jgi:hypothetical protein
LLATPVCWPRLRPLGIVRRSKFTIDPILAGNLGRRFVAVLRIALDLRKGLAALVDYPSSLRQRHLFHVESPLFTLLPLVACWRYEPREHLRPLALSRPAIPPSPLRDRVSYSDHDRFRGYFPVHFIPAYNLPVYASQRPLPDATQDSVRGCSLGFAAAVIADGRLQRACKAQPAQNRTGADAGSRDQRTGSIKCSYCVPGHIT